MGNYVYANKKILFALSYHTLFSIPKTLKFVMFLDILKAFSPPAGEEQVVQIIVELEREKLNIITKGKFLEEKKKLFSIQKT